MRNVNGERTKSMTRLPCSLTGPVLHRACVLVHRHVSKSPSSKSPTPGPRPSATPVNTEPWSAVSCTCHIREACAWQPDTPAWLQLKGIEVRVKCRTGSGSASHLLIGCPLIIFQITDIMMGHAQVKRQGCTCCRVDQPAGQTSTGFHDKMGCHELI